MVSPDGSVTALTVGCLGSAVCSAMPVSCGPFLGPESSWQASAGGRSGKGVTDQRRGVGGRGRHEAERHHGGESELPHESLLAGSVVAGQRRSTVSPDGSVTASTIGCWDLTVGSAMPVSCGPFW